VGLLSPFRSEVAPRIGLAPRAGAWTLLPETLLLAVFFARVAVSPRGAEGPRRLLFWWLGVPLLGLWAEGFWFGNFHPHWAAFLLPVAWLACADSLFWFAGLMPARRPVLAGLCALLLAVHGAQSLRLERHVRETGGEGAHLPSVGTKEAVMARISESPGMPSLYEVVIPYGKPWYVDVGGWNYLREAYLRGEWRGRASPGKFFYLYAENGVAAEPALLPALRAVPGVKEERIGSVVLFTSDTPIEGGGVRVR
jgi:hypothetical protein